MVQKLPHHDVYARFAPSKIHGVGIQAIRAIKKGTYIFRGEDLKVMWVEKKQIRRLPKPIRQLYEDFGIVKGDLCGCPVNFNQMNPSWYLNHSKNPNVGCGKNYQFYALRNIKKGEELTVDYATYSEH